MFCWLYFLILKIKNNSIIKTEPKKIVIVTYYWPPAGGPGVQRWLKFVKYLPSFGIEPHIYIPENPTYPLQDDNLDKEIESSTIIIKKKIVEPYKWASLFSKNKTKKMSSGIVSEPKKQHFLEKLMLWIRGNLFIPDARVLWVKPSVKFLKKYLLNNNIDTIITTGPPHSLHLIGNQLKKENKALTWIADFRDPWTTIGYHKKLKLTTIAQRIHKKKEKEILQNASKIIVTSPTTKKEFTAITTTPITVITNGYDVEIFTKKESDKKFTLAHIGSLLSDRNPEILWQVLSELLLENSDFKKDFQLKLIGTVSASVLHSIKKYQLYSYVNNLGYVSHKKALEEQYCSKVLLLIEINSSDTQCIIPGKLFEYMVTERPIVAIGPKGADFETILNQTNSGTFFTYIQKQELKEHLLHLFKKYKENNLISYPVGLKSYSRKELTKKLVKVINS